MLTCDVLRFTAHLLANVVEVDPRNLLFYYNFLMGKAEFSMSGGNIL